MKDDIYDNLNLIEESPDNFRDAFEYIMSLFTCRNVCSFINFAVCRKWDILLGRENDFYKED